jgi:hypothetical protein
VATRLGSLKAADIASSAAELTITVDDTAGFVMSSGRDGWLATFGIYTQTLRPPSIVPGQVRLLKSILVAQGEANLARIDLARTVEGTYERKDGR